jgi:hypothetical protein
VYRVDGTARPHLEIGGRDRHFDGGRRHLVKYLVFMVKGLGFSGKCLVFSVQGLGTGCMVYGLWFMV